MPIAHTDVAARQTLYSSEAQYLVVPQLELRIMLVARRELAQKKRSNANH